MGNKKTVTSRWGCSARVMETVAVAIVALGVQQSAQGQQDPGRFEIRSASVELQSGV